MSTLDDLRKLATAATPGPWEHRKFRGINDRQGFVYKTTGMCSQVCRTIELGTTRDADFIAAANPAVVIALLECIEAADWVTGPHVSGISLTDSRDAYRDARAKLEAALEVTP